MSRPSQAASWTANKVKLVVNQASLDELKELAANDSMEGKDVEVGIDEAGRGPVLGPMVYGGVAWPITFQDKLAKLGFRDSKKLDEAARDTLFEHLGQLNGKIIATKAVVSSPLQISTKQFSWKKESLNTFSHNCAISIIRHFLSKGLRVTKAFLDTVGDAKKYQDLLVYEFRDVVPQIEFVVSSKADDIWPVVSAASIIAKVTRDKAIQNTVFKESINVSREFGCGYPGDEKTIKWLNDHFTPFFGYPSIVRFSWSTISKRLENKGYEYEFTHNTLENKNKITFVAENDPLLKKGRLMKRLGYDPKFQL